MSAAKQFVEQPSNVSSMTNTANAGSVSSKRKNGLAATFLAILLLFVLAVIFWNCSSTWKVISYDQAKAYFGRMSEVSAASFHGVGKKIDNLHQHVVETAAYPGNGRTKHFSQAGVPDENSSGSMRSLINDSYSSKRSQIPGVVGVQSATSSSGASQERARSESVAGGLVWQADAAFPSKQQGNASARLSSQNPRPETFRQLKVLAERKSGLPVASSGSAAASEQVPPRVHARSLYDASSRQQSAENSGASSRQSDTRLASRKRFAEAHLRRSADAARSLPKCGGMPSSFGPRFTEQSEPPVRTKSYLGKRGVVLPLNLYGRQVQVRTEHGRRGRRTATNRRSLAPGEEALVRCLNNLGKCDNHSMAAALNLRGMREALRRDRPMLKGRPRSCAVVGNSGGMMHHKYGPFIDKHDYVMRINILPMTRHRDHLGWKVDGRVLSYKMTKDVATASGYRPDNPSVEFFIWFPASTAEAKARIEKKFPTNRVHVMPQTFLNSAVLAFKALRTELLRLGYGPFEDWEFMTSGMHAVMGLVRSCDVVDLYGFTTDMNARGPYWFTGRKVPPRSGQTQHAWDHERMVLRLLHAAGAIHVCTS